MLTQTEPNWISIASLVVSIGAVFFSWLANNKANSIQNGMIELEIRQSIENSKSRISDVSMKMAELVAKKNSHSITTEENETLKIYDQNLNAATQSMLNTYDTACAKYLDNKIDKIRFKKSYDVEIRNLVENTDLKNMYFGIDSNYQPILKVYKEWNNK